MPKDKEKTKKAILDLLKTLDGDDIFNCDEFGVKYSHFIIGILNKYAELVEVDWSQVEQDTPVYVIDIKNYELKPMYFSSYNKEYNDIWLFKNGATSFSAVNSIKVFDKILLKDDLDKIIKEVPMLSIEAGEKWCQEIVNG